MTDPHTHSLFDESAYQPRAAAQSVALLIRAEPGRKLSREERDFNTLLTRLTDLEQRLATERDALDETLRRYGKDVGPLEQARAERRIQLAHALDAAVDRLAIGKRQTSRLRAMILDLCSEAFCVATPDKAAEELYTRWSATSFEDERREQVIELREEMAEQARAFGIDVDLFEEDTSEDGTARFVHRLREQMRAAQETEAGDRAPRSKVHRRTTKGKTLVPGDAKAGDFVRTLYLSLAKVLHPDAVADSCERALRADCMKQASRAYRDGDVAALLRLELRWIPQPGRLERTAEALRAYVPALRKLLLERERALDELLLDPRYLPITPVLGLPARRAWSELARRAKFLRQEIAEMDGWLGAVKRCRSRSDLGGLVRDWLEERCLDTDL